MKAWRTEPRTTEQIVESIESFKANARADMQTIHLIPCDYEQVALHPARFNVIKQRNGKLQTVFQGRLIAVVSVE